VRGVGLVVLAIAAIGVAQGAELKIRCQVAPADKRYYAWREIDGKKCWFKGSRDTPKSMLFWGPDENVRRARSAADRGSDRFPNAGSDFAPVSVTVLPWAPEPMRAIGAFEQRWRDLMIDLKAGLFTDPTPSRWK
jgi:hypothetical protein